VDKENKGAFCKKGRLYRFHAVNYRHSLMWRSFFQGITSQTYDVKLNNDYSSPGSSIH